VRSTGVVVLCSLICLAMVGRFDRSNLIMVYLLGVAVVATRDGRGPSILAACLSVAIFDFFFVPPYLTFAVSDSQYIVTFAVMLIVSLLISSLAIRVRDQAEAARQRERRVQALYAMSRDLTGRGTPDEVRRVTCHHVGELFHGSAVVLLPDASARLVIHPGDDVASLNNHEMSVAQWVFEHGQKAGQGTDTLPGAAALYIPLLSAGRVEGVLGLRPDPALLPLSPDQMDLMETLCRQAAGALEHSRLSAENEQARVTAEREQLRSTLLSSLSHDVRTPLTTIMGAATSLLQQPRLTESVRDELTASIHDEAQRLNRLALNVLDLTSLESSSVPLRKEWYSIEEILGSALTRLDELLGKRHVETRLPADLPLVPLDPILIEQVLVNLLENAVRYTPPSSPVLIEARGEAGEVVIEVADEGPGLRPGDEERVFDKFHRGPSGERGFGLGLAICRAILTAHGGRIEAQNREAGGALFRFRLPIEGTPPPLPSPESRPTTS
jgi:two-component system, OmpR family, sensor histidine kinase KdpD